MDDIFSNEKLSLLFGLFPKDERNMFSGEVSKYMNKKVE